MLANTCIFNYDKYPHTRVKAIDLNLGTMDIIACGFSATTTMGSNVEMYASIKCHACNQFGHFESQCPTEKRDTKNTTTARKMNLLNISEKKHVSSAAWSQVHEAQK